MAFYFGGELQDKYSTPDIAGDALNVRRTISHYTVIESIKGYHWTNSSNRYEFLVRAIDGRTLRFDPATGQDILGR